MANRRFLVPLSAALVAALSSASSSGLLIRDAAAQVGRRPDDEDDSDAPLILAVADARSVGMLAHQSHSSHASHYSGGGGGGGGGGGYYVAPQPTQPPPPPPKPASVSFIAYPGGRIFVDGVAMGSDSTGTLTLKPGTHEIRVENRFLGDHQATVVLSDGQTGVVSIEW